MRKARREVSPEFRREAVHQGDLDLGSVCSMIYIIAGVNGCAYMTFKEATDGLFVRIDHENLANRLGVSVAKIRQARLRPEAEAHRPPPKHWREAVIRMAEAQIMHHRKLIEKVRTEVQEEQ